MTSPKYELGNIQVYIFLNDDSESTGKTTGAYFQEDVKLFRATANI